MPLAASTRLGPYEIVALIGAGGMGEVYRAVDTRVDRYVAVKLLPASWAADPDRFARFEREARAAAALSHPNLLAVFDFGEHGGCPYIVSELLEGESLRERLRSGPLSARKLAEYGLPLCRGLAAAHDKGIIHRDLKPENIFLTGSGQVKILDFGLARTAHAEGALAATAVSTVAVATSPGQILGTPGYMSPEAVRGEPADARSDIFSLGAVFYEMLSGQRAFRGDNPIETLNAILKQDPPELSESGRKVPPALERIVYHCLEKNPAERFQSAHDLAFALESLSASSETSAPSLARRKYSRRLSLAALAGLPAVAGIAGGIYLGRRSARPSEPSFHRLTYRRGTVRQARFMPDGQNILYAATWDGNPWELFATRFDGSQSRPLGLGDAQLLAISQNGELAVSLRPRPAGLAESGTLATLPYAGGAPRELLDGVTHADWSPDGSELAIARVAPAATLEFPPGKAIYSRNGWFPSDLRVSPGGDLLAFIAHSAFDMDYGRVVVIDRRGNKKLESRAFGTILGLAWAAGGREVWFTAAPGGGQRALYAIDLSGRERLLMRAPAHLLLMDISRDGRLLLSKETVNWGIMALPPGGNAEQDLSWYSWSLLSDVSSDGGLIVFIEGGEAGEDRWGVFLRKTDGSPAVRLGDGVFGRLSPDGKWVAALTQFQEDAGSQLIVLPTGAGAARQLTRDSVVRRGQAYGWLPDSSGLLCTWAEEGKPARTHLVTLEGGPPRPVTPERVVGTLATPDGRAVLARGPGGWMLHPIAEGTARPVAGLAVNAIVLGWHSDGKRLRVREADRILLVDPGTGAIEDWRRFAPAILSDRAGLLVQALRFSADGRAYAYTYRRLLSELYVVEGLG